MLSGKRKTDSRLSPSHEHYLRAIWELRARSGYARLTDVAHELGVSHATLSVGLRSLEKTGLVAHDAHRMLLLTSRGERVAREVHHRFCVLRSFLVEVLGVPSERAEREACLMEHDLSAETTERFVDLLKLIADDVRVRELLRDRLTGYQRHCDHEDCGTCGLACLTPTLPT